VESGERRVGRGEWEFMYFCVSVVINLNSISMPVWVKALTGMPF